MGGAVLEGRGELSTHLKVVVDQAMGGEDPLGVAGGSEPSHVPLAPSGAGLRSEYSGSGSAMLAVELQLPFRGRV